MPSSKDFQIYRLALGLTFSLIGRLIIAGFWYLYRYVISILVCNRWIGQDHVRQLISSNHYLGRDGSLLIAHNLLVSFQIDGKLNLEQFRRLFLEKCVRAKRSNRQSEDRLEFPELQEKIVISLGYPFWKKDNRFEISNHILDGNNLKRQGLSEGGLEQNILNEQFKGNERSPWKIYIFQESEKFTRLIFCFHHSLGDGRSLYNVLMRVADVSKTEFEIKEKMADTRNPNLSTFDQLNKSAKLLLPTNLIRDFIKCYPLPAFYVPNMTEDGRYFVRSSKIPLQDLKGISRQQGVPLTAVLLCAMTGALRKYLSRSQLDIPDWVFCPMPIPLLTEASGLTNAVQSVNFTLPLGVDILEDRLLECKKTLENAQKSRAFPLLVKLDLTMENCYPLNRKPEPQGMPPLVLTSFAGPKSTISFCGKDHNVTDMHFSWNGVKYISVIFTTITYKDGIRITISADKNAFRSQSSAELVNVIQLLENEVKLMKLIKSH